MHGSERAGAADTGAGTPHGQLGVVGCPALDAFMDGGVDDIFDWLNASDASPPPAEMAAASEEGGRVVAVTAAGQAADSDARQGLVSAISAAAQTASMYGYTLHVKLTNAHAPADVPRDEMLAGMEHEIPGVLPLTGISRAGCVHLTFDGMATTDSALDAHAAADALAGILSAQKLGAVVPGSSVLLFGDARTAPAAAPLPVTDAHVAAAMQAGFSIEWPLLVAGWPCTVPPQLQGLAPGVALLQHRADGSATAKLALGTPLDTNTPAQDGSTITTSVHCRAYGESLAQQPSGTSTELHVAVPAAVASQGCIALLVEVQTIQRWPEGSGQNPVTTLSRPLTCLATRDAAVVTQVGNTCATLAKTGEHGEMDALLRVCGNAFRPDAPLSIRVAAAKACLTLGWDALLKALLQMPHLRPADRGALVLACEGHMRRCSTGPVNSECVDAVNAVALLLWLPSAPQAAVTLLRVAREEEGHAIPESAIEAALLVASAQKDDGGATALLEAMQLLRSDGQPAMRLPGHLLVAHDQVDEDGVGTEDEEARYATFLTVYNHSLWTMVCVLTPLAGLAGLKCAWVDILSQANVPLRDRLESISTVKLDLVRQTRLHPFLAGAVTDIMQVSWPRVLTVARLDVLLVLLVRLPTDFAMVFLLVRYLSTRQKRARLMANPALGLWLNSTLQTLTLATAVFYMLQDILIAWGTSGAAVEWPASTSSFYALGEVLTFRAVLFPPRYYAASWFACLFAYFNMLLFVPRAYAIVLNNYGYSMQIVALTYSALMAGRRDAAMRQLWRQSEAAGTGGKQKKA